MDVLKAVQTYVFKMITEVPGMKVLLLDAHTVRHCLSVSANDLDANRLAGHYSVRAALTRGLLDR